MMDRLRSLCRNLDVTREDGATVVATSADRLDGMCHDELQTVLEYLTTECGERRVVVDMTGVSRVSSFTVACIGYYARQVEAAEGKLVVTGLDERCRKPFQLAGILDGLTLAPTRADGVRVSKG